MINKYILCFEFSHVYFLAELVWDSKQEMTLDGFHDCVMVVTLSHLSLV